MRGQRRLQDAIRAIERMPKNLKGITTSIGSNESSFWAYIKAYNKDSQLYSFSRFLPDVNAPLNIAPTFIPPNYTEALAAYEMTGQVVEVGAIVRMRYMGKNASGNPRWSFVARPPYTMFAVRVYQTGGSAGDATTQCSFTYTVKMVLADVTLLTNQTPLKTRPSIGRMAAPPAGSIGLAYVDELNVLHLHDANETLDVEACDGGLGRQGIS